MKINKPVFFISIGVSLFLGIIVGAALIGAVVKPVHKLTGAPFCRGTIDITETRFDNGPESSYSDLDVSCIAEDGTRKEITTQSFVVLGAAGTLIFFVLIAYFMRGLLFMPQGLPAADPMLKDAGKRIKNNQSGLERLSELKRMRDENLISQAEFEQKKDEIMKEL